MFTKVSRPHEEWFRGWVEKDDFSYLEDFPRRIVILHPGTVVVDDPRLPFQAPNPNDERLSDEQLAILEPMLLDALGPDKECALAIYAGFLGRKDHGLSEGFDEPEGTWVEGLLYYVLFAGKLKDSTFSAVQQHWRHIELSYLWAQDRSWILASAPDTAFTAIGCNDEFAATLLDSPMLGAIEWFI